MLMLLHVCIAFVWLDHPEDMLAIFQQMSGVGGALAAACWAPRPLPLPTSAPPPPALLPLLLLSPLSAASRRRSARRKAPRWCK